MRRKAKFTGRILKDKDGDEYARHKGKRLRVVRAQAEGLPRNPIDAWVQDTVSQTIRTWSKDGKPRVLKYGVSEYCREPYDVSAMDLVRKQGGLEAFVRRMLPHLSPYRQAVAAANIASVCHAKQREDQRQRDAVKASFEFRARRLTKKERRKKRYHKSALSSLKELLRK